MQRLAINGGSPEIKHKFKLYRTIGLEELRAVTKVIKSGTLSQFYGSWCEHFYGGVKIKEFEKSFAEHFHAKYAITVNSATSGLIVAVGAIAVGPGDEVIVSPYTMSASATAILMFNAVPVFADIDERTFNISPESISKVVTKRTKAILVPNIFGHPADYNEIWKIARKHNLRIIEDNAQAPGARYRDKYTGTIGDIGVFSLNYHKHIHTGEGGVCLTNDKALAERMQLIRNHAEAVAGEKGETNYVNLLGYNFRMGEMEAAIGIEQLKKLNTLVRSRVHIAEALSEKLSDIQYLTTPYLAHGSKHVYYNYGLKYAGSKVPREKIVKALNAEGVEVAGGYVKPLYLQPLYQKLIAYGDKGCPFKCPLYRGKVNYKKGICPTAERMHYKELISLAMCQYNYSENDIKCLSRAFHKVFDNLSDI